MRVEPRGFISLSTAIQLTASMKKCNLKSPFYYHRRGFVIENKTDFNRSPCFMIIFIHVEGLFGLGRTHNIIYITHCVCGMGDAIPPVR